MKLCFSIVLSFCHYGLIQESTFINPKKPLIVNKRELYIYIVCKACENVKNDLNNPKLTIFCKKIR